MPQAKAQAARPKRSSGSSTSSRRGRPSATGRSSTPTPRDCCARRARRPEVEGSAGDVVEDRRPGLDRLVRRLGDRRLAAALALRQVRPDQEHRDDVQALHLDGVEGDRRVLELADDVHRERRHEPEGGARRRAQVRRRQGERPAVRRRRCTRATPETFYALAAQMKISSYFNLSLNHGGSIDSWRRWLATQRADPHAPRRRPHVGRRRRQRRQHGRLPAQDQARRPRGLDRRLHADRFIVRNSWGTGWGDKGFGYASLAYAQDAFTEAYGIAV